MRKEEDRKFLPQSIFTYALPDLPELLRQAQQDAAVVQELVLMDILKDAGNTQIGEKYGFSHIGSIEEYRRRVPVSEYADYAEYTEQLKQGEKDVLFAGKADSFAITTGTTGKPKYIPESKKGAMVKAIVGNMRTMDMLRMLPGIMLPQIKILAIVNSAVYSKTEGGIEAGAASGKAVADAPLTAKSVFPVEVLGLSDLSTEAMDYLTLLFGVSERHVGGLICNNLIHFKRLFDRLNAAPGQIIADIRRGEVSLKLPEQARRILEGSIKADPERAEELERIYREGGSLTVEEIWPEFMGVGCWMSSSVGRGVKEMKKYFPERTTYVDWGYGASEGKFNIPCSPNCSAGYPAVFGYFFEFLPMDGGEPLLLEETQAGEKYELILTSYSGYYRYNIHDIVRIGEDEQGWKTMEFYCKSSEHVEINGKRIYGGRLLELAAAYEEETGELLTLIQGTSADGALELLAEPSEACWQPDAFRSFMEKGLAEDGIRLGKIDVKEPGYRDSLFGLHLKLGKTVNQTKLPVFI